MSSFLLYSFFFFFNDTATTEIYTLSLHDALPILQAFDEGQYASWTVWTVPSTISVAEAADRKSTRLNSSHLVISYAVFCLKKKKKCKIGRISIISFANTINILSFTFTS